MSDNTDVAHDDRRRGEIAHTPVVSCARCGREWSLEYELDSLQAGNQAVEQFALDHKRHTGHYPDDVTPWTASCRHCPAGEAFLAERPARRWARTHARHTSHGVVVEHDGDVEARVSDVG